MNFREQQRAEILEDRRVLQTMLMLAEFARVTPAQRAGLEQALAHVDRLERKLNLLERLTHLAVQKLERPELLRLITEEDPDVDELVRLITGQSLDEIAGEDLDEDV